MGNEHEGMSNVPHLREIRDQINAESTGRSDQRMKDETGIQGFKVMPWLRATRDRIYEETKHMSWEEERRRYDEISRNSPWFGKLKPSPIVKPRRPRTEREATREQGE